MWEQFKYLTECVIRETCMWISDNQSTIFVVFITFAAMAVLMALLALLQDEERFDNTKLTC